MKPSKALVIGLFLTLLFCGVKAKGQTRLWLSRNNVMVEGRVHYGFFYHHHFEMERFNAHYGAIELSVLRKTFGNMEWEADYRYPYVGLTFYHSRLGGFKELGQVYALYPFINYPLNNNPNSQLTFKLGVGLGYLTEHFEPYIGSDGIPYYYNFSIGSHLNAAVNLSFEYRQHITDRLMSVASMGLTHFSNGSTKLPNYGLNTISGALGLAYHLGTPRGNENPGSRPQYYPFEFDRKRWLSLDLDYGIGFKNVSQTLGGDSAYFYPVHDLSAFFLGQFTRYSRAGVGLSLVLDMSDQTLPELDSFNIRKLTRLNFSVCYAMTMDRLSYYFEFGWHLKYNDVPLSKGNIFQKVTARYQLYNNIYAHLALMTHFGRADYLCFGLGYRFNQKYYLNHEKKTRHHPPGLH